MRKPTKLDAFKEKLKAMIPDIEKYEFFHLKGNDFNLALKAFSAKLGDRWNENIEKPDYYIYQHEDYLIECIWTYVVSSGGAIENMFKYFREINNPTVMKETIIDVHNGVGLTTLDLSKNWIGPVCYYNTCPLQVKAMENLHNLSCINHPARIDHLETDKFGVVLCLETIEHIKSPMMFTRTLMNMSTQYLVETTSFCSPQHCGHFKEYEIDRITVSGRTASRKVHDLIRTEFTQVFSGFNGRPRIWKRKEVNKLLEM
jgi:hypothetical protein